MTIEANENSIGIARDLVSFPTTTKATRSRPQRQLSLSLSLSLCSNNDNESNDLTLSLLIIMVWQRAVVLGSLTCHERRGECTASDNHLWESPFPPSLPLPLRPAGVGNGSQEIVKPIDHFIFSRIFSRAADQAWSNRIRADHRRFFSFRRRRGVGERSERKGIQFRLARGTLATNRERSIGECHRSNVNRNRFTIMADNGGAFVFEKRIFQVSTSCVLRKKKKFPLHSRRETYTRVTSWMHKFSHFHDRRFCPS